MHHAINAFNILGQQNMVQNLRNAGSDVASSLRVWQTEGCELHAVGKAPSAGLYSVLAWQPNGRHLYAAHAQGNHHRVVLYETNGLEHGGFDVPRSGLSLLNSLCLGNTPVSRMQALRMHTKFLIILLVQLGLQPCLGHAGLLSCTYSAHPPMCLSRCRQTHSAQLEHEFRAAGSRADQCSSWRRTR